jgi:hypothetical protein
MPSQYADQPGFSSERPAPAGPSLGSEFAASSASPHGGAREDADRGRGENEREGSNDGEAEARHRGRVPIAVVGFTVAGGRIAEIDLIANPAKLAHLVFSS